MSVGESAGWLRSLRRYRQLAIVTTVGICVLVVAGAVVRLTGSGLGCDDWPNCNEERFVDVSSGHTAIEQINRLLSGVIGVPTLLLAIAAFRQRMPETGARRSGLRWPAIGVLVSVLANGVVGGIAVRGDLHPALVQSHFLLAMVSISFGMIALHRSAPTAQNSADSADSVTQRLSTAVAVLSAAALATGTVVTGTGPHAGEEDVRRFGFDISAVARIHSVTVLATLAVAIGLAWYIQSNGTNGTNGTNGSTGTSVIVSTLSAWIFVGLLQGVVGYIQYFNGVPEVLVGVHVALATGLWVLSMRLAILARSARIAKHDREVARAPLQNA